MSGPRTRPRALLRPIERDLRRILLVQGLRAFVYGFGSVLLGSALAAGGLSDVEVGVIFTAMLAGMALTSVLVGIGGERLGRRRSYRLLLATMGLVGIAFALSDWLPLLVAAALTGTLSTDPNESGPITSIEQAMIGEAPAATRLSVFGRYNAVAFLAGAVGALAAGGPSALRALVPALPPDQRWLLAFPLGAAACLAAAHKLSGEVEAQESPRTGRSGALHRSRRRVSGLAALFAVDSFAGGFVVQSFMVFWFGRRFGATAETMGLVFFAAGLLQAASSVMAARVGARIGLLNTMVFTHLPSNVLLALVPLAPTLPLAVATLLARFALSQMDVPTRQAYLMAMVDPRERTAAAAFTNTARSVARPGGPVLAGVFMQHIAQGAPWAAAGVLKAVYDLVLYATFRRIPVPGEPTPRPG